VGLAVIVGERELNTKIYEKRANYDTSMKIWEDR
jgi:hypothetical protein